MKLKLLDGSAKVVLAGQAETMHGPGAVLAQIDLVEIGFQNLFLGIPGIQNDRHHDFVDLAPPGALGRQVKVLDQLLCQRATALNDAPSANVDKNRPHNAAQRDAVMAVKITVLAGEQGIQELIGSLIEFDQCPIFAACRVETANLCGLHPQEWDGFTGGHVLEEDNLILGELRTQLAGWLGLIRKLKIPGFENHFIP